MDLFKATLLIVSDKKENMEYFSRVLNDFCLFRTAEDIIEAKQILSSFSDISVMLLDIEGYENIIKFAGERKTSTIPAIVCVNGDNEHESELAFSAGAVELIQTPFHKETIINRVLNFMRYSLGYAVYDDGFSGGGSFVLGPNDKLTRLHNRLSSEKAINELISSPNFKSGVLVLIDISKLKEVNNAFGYQRGDKLLVDYARRIEEYFTEDAEICRYSGNDFVVFIEYGKNEEEIFDRIKFLPFAFSSVLNEGDKSIALSVCIGTALAPKNGTTFTELCQKADKALYRSKIMGDNVVTHYSDKMLFGTKENVDYRITTLDYQNIMDSIKVSALCALTEKEHRILYFNRRAAEITPGMKVGAICHDIWKHDCENCPLVHMGDAEYVRAVRFDAQMGEEVEIQATRILWHDSIPAFFLQISPRFDENKVNRSGRERKVLQLPITSNEDETALEDKKYSVGQFSEKVYFTGKESSFTEKDQAIIDTLLALNHGVGIISGYYDADMTINMISELAIKSLHFSSFEEFSKSTGGSLLSAVSSQKEKEFLRKKLLNVEKGVWSFPLSNIDGDAVSLRISSAIGVSAQGKRMWYMTISRFDEHYYDSLTGGLNLDGFVHSVEELRERNADLRMYAILYVDVKGFKSLNDLYGTEGGENLLVTVYKRLALSKLDPVVCSRKGSDHFLLLVKKDYFDPKELADVLNVEWVYGNRKLFLHCVCGIYYIDDNDCDISHMIDCANVASNSIQDEYVKPFAYFDNSMNSVTLSRIEVLSRFFEGLENREFKVYYQPIFSALTQKVVAAEALVRWDAGSKGLIAPDKFIPALEQSGYIVKLDHYMIENVDELITQRLSRSLPVVPISVNLSRMDFFVEGEINSLLRHMERHPDICTFLHFEITESSNISLKERQIRFIETIRNLSGEVYLDDFGSGSASLEMIADYDFSVIKIDMHFISQIVSNYRTALLVETIISMAHKLNLCVVAEGVETKDQLEVLKTMGCDFIQGYLFSKPLSKENFIRYLDESI